MEETNVKEELESGVPRARAIRAIRQWIQQGALGAGETLPSERALASRLGVGRATVRRALEVLEAEGLIVDRGGHVRSVAAGGGGFMRQVVAVVGACGAEALDALREAGAHALVVEAGKLDEGQIRQFVGLRPGGLVVADAEGEAGAKVLAAAGEAGLAVVVDSDSPQVDRVVVDEEMGAYELVKWVIGQGRRRVLIVLREKEGWREARRLAGYEKALGETGLEVLTPVRVPRVQVDGAAEARLLAGYLMERLSGDSAPDAVVAGSDGDAEAVAAACALVGKEVVVAGYGQGPAGPAAGGSPSIAAMVDLREGEVGRTMVALLRERMAGKLPAEAQRRVVTPKVVVVEPEKKEPAAQVPLTAAGQIGAVEAKEEKPLFGWKMSGGRWTLGGKK